MHFRCSRTRNGLVPLILENGNLLLELVNQRLLFQNPTNNDGLAPSFQ